MSTFGKRTGDGTVSLENWGLEAEHLIPSTEELNAHIRKEVASAIEESLQTEEPFLTLKTPEKASDLLINVYLAAFGDNAPQWEFSLWDAIKDDITDYDTKDAKDLVERLHLIAAMAAEHLSKKST